MNLQTIYFDLSPELLINKLHVRHMVIDPKDRVKIECMHCENIAKSLFLGSPYFFWGRRWSNPLHGTEMVTARRLALQQYVWLIRWLGNSE